MRPTSLVLTALLAMGCGPTPVRVDVGFPSTETFLFSEQGQLLVYDVAQASDGGGLGDCPLILENIEGGTLGDPVLDSGRLPICSFRNGGVGFGDVAAGPKAFVMLAYDEANTLLLLGCVIGEAYDGADALALDVYPTDDYAGAIMGDVLTCGNEDDKCTRGCR